MDAAIKEQWIKDLTSGDFQQGQTRLEKDGAYCCLGVLCHQAWKAGVVQRSVSEFGNVSYAMQAAVLPDKVMVWAGIDDARGGYGWSADDGREGGYLAVDNDEFQHDFLKIADTIEKYF